MAARHLPALSVLVLVCLTACGPEEGTASLPDLGATDMSTLPVDMADAAQDMLDQSLDLDSPDMAEDMALPDMPEPLDQAPDLTLPDEGMPEDMAPDLSPPDMEGVEDLGPSPEEVIVYVSSREDGLELWATGSKSIAPFELSTATMTSVSFPSFSADGARLVMLAASDLGTGLHLLTLPGRQLSFVDTGNIIASTATLAGTNTLYFEGRQGMMTDRGDIYKMTLGQMPTKLTTDPAADGSPVWNEATQTLYFTSNRDGAGDVYRWDEATQSAVRLTETGAVLGRPTLSSDGTFMAVVVDGGDGRVARVYRMETPLREVGRVGDCQEPSFGPDDRWLACVTSGGAAVDVVWVEWRNGMRTRLSMDEFVDLSPTVSPMKYLMPF